MESVKKSFTRDCFVSFITLLILFLYVFYFSANTLWLEDDANYMFKFVINDPPTITNTSDEYISSLSDVIESQYAHYFVSNGRILAHLIVQLINPFLSRYVFAILNGIAYVFFVLLIIKFGLSLRTNSRTRMTTVFNHPLAVGFVALMTQFSLMLKFTPTTAMYIWMYDLVLLYLLILFFYKPKSQWWSLLLFPFAIIVGNAHESINIGLALGLFIFGIRNIRRLKPNDYAMLFGFAIGVILIALSPTSRNRAVFSSFKILNILLTFIFLKATFIFIILLWKAVKKKHLKISKFYRNNMLLIDSLLGCLLFCVIIKNTNPRALYGAEVLSLILSIVVWRHHLSKKIIVSCLAIMTATVAYSSMLYNNRMNERILQHTELKKLLVQSETGEVEYDFPSGKDALERTIKYYFFPYGPPNMYTYKGIYAHNEFTRQTYSKYINHELGTKKDIRYKNPIESKMCHLPDSNQIIEQVPGNYYAIISKKNPPKEVIVKRSALGGLIDWSSYKLFPNSSTPDYQTDKLMVYSAYDRMLFVGIDSVSVVE